MNFELVVHIGQTKAGSTSIQKSLRGATDTLAAQKVFYLGLMCEHAGGKKRAWQRPEGWPQLAALGTEKAGEELAKVAVRSVEELREAGIERAIWSNETFLGNDPIVLPALRQLTESGVDLRIVAYVRRPDTWVQSAYLQWGIKHKDYAGPLQPFREWVAGRHKGVGKNLEPWFGLDRAEVLVRNFEACGDVVEDFLEICGLEGAGIDRVRSNESPNPVALALWALHNAQIDDPVLPAELEPLLKKGGVLGDEPRDVDLDALFWDDADIAKVWDESRGDRRRVNELLREAGQPEISDERLPARRLEATQGQINAALLALIKSQFDQIQVLRRQLRRLRREVEEDPGPGPP